MATSGLKLIPNTRIRRTVHEGMNSHEFRVMDVRRLYIELQTKEAMILRKIFKCAVSISAFLTASIVGASENGAISYPVGVETVLNGILPAPGDTQFYNYLQFYDAHQMVGPTGNSAVPNFKLDVLVDALRVVHTWGVSAGPFTLSTGIVLPTFNLNIHVNGLSDRRAGIGDIVLQPAMIGYSNQDHTLFAYFTPDISLKTGAYSTTNIVNPGRNVYAFMPNLNVTWFPKQNWELSAALTYEVDSPNHATDYHSGNVGMFEYLLGYSITPKLQLGVQGYYLKQVTDDVQDGEVVGNRGQAIAIGPQVVYHFAPHAGIVFKYQREFDVRNRPSGNKLWMELSFPL
jgi:hypothetical protein